MDSGSFPDMLVLSPLPEGEFISPIMFYSYLSASIYLTVQLCVRSTGPLLCRAVWRQTLGLIHL